MNLNEYCIEIDLNLSGSEDVNNLIDELKTLINSKYPQAEPKICFY